MTDLPRRVAIVTGGARGIGRACAHALAEHGFEVARVDLLEPEMERTACEIRERGGLTSVHVEVVDGFQWIA